MDDSPPEGVQCQWKMFREKRERECEHLATVRSGLGGMIQWVCAEHKALEMPSQHVVER